jgi:hypothetical protein
MAFRLKVLAVCAAAGLLASVPAGLGLAAPSAQDPGCDTEFMDAVSARGWMEGQRELTQAENLIFKSDSVLEYTCFQQMLEVVAVKAAPQFPESVLWSEVPGITSLSTDIALEQIIGQELIAYLQANFSHSFRGGRVIPVDSPAAERNPGAYVCDAMKYVWQESKCAPFMEKEPRLSTNDNLDIDGFYEFSRYAVKDPRQLPLQAAACQVPQTSDDDGKDKQSIYALVAKAAYNFPEESGGGSGFPNTPYELPYPVPDHDDWKQENPNDAALYNDDPIKSHLQFILPATDCGTGFTPAGGPIPTGIQVHLLGAHLGDYDNDYEEHICANPGCSYKPKPGGDGGGECTVQY